MCQVDAKFWEKVLSMETNSQNRYNLEREKQWGNIGNIMGKQWKQ